MQRSERLHAKGECFLMGRIKFEDMASALERIGCIPRCKRRFSSANLEFEAFVRARFL
jgi:hypothetical protein